MTDRQDHYHYGNNTFVLESATIRKCDRLLNTIEKGSKELPNKTLKHIKTHIFVTVDMSRLICYT